MPRFSPNELTALAARAFESAGARPSMAAAAAEALVAADAQGLATHGVSRVPFCAAMLRNGRADGTAVPRVVRERGAVCLVDNASALAYESVRLAVECAMVAEEGVRVPGARRFALARESRDRGIEISKALAADLRHLAEV